MTAPTFIFSLILSLFVSSRIASANDWLPLEKDNTWSLKNSAGVSAIFTVGDVIRSRSQTLARMRVQTETGAETSWILVKNASGISIAGLTIGDRDVYYDEPTPLFPADGEDGQVWVGPGTSVVQMVSGISFRTPAGQMRNATEYQVEFLSDGSKQRWILVEGVGFAAGGETEQRLLLQNYRLMPPAAASKPPTGASCARIGISSIPDNDQLTAEDRGRALAPVVASGAKFLSLSIEWKSLEREPYRYSLERLRDEFKLLSTYDVDAVLNIRPIDNVRDLRPDDLAGRSWEDPETMMRFAAAVDAVLEDLPEQVRWINIGYEVDSYFLERPDEAVPYLKFFTFAADVVRRKTGRSVGTVFMFDVTRVYDGVFRVLEQTCDHVTFNYYALKPGDRYQHRAPQAPELDALIMRSMAKGRPILITEAGYSSHPVIGPGPDAQADFFSNLLAATDGGGFAAVNVWALFDLPEAEARHAQSLYRLDHVVGSGEFLSSLGLITADGNPKPSLGAVINHLATPCKQ